jgi:hypothetical protein
MSAVGDARKRRDESAQAPVETVPVPRHLIDALRSAIAERDRLKGHQMMLPSVIDEARALIEAVT